MCRHLTSSFDRCDVVVMFYIIIIYIDTEIFTLLSLFFTHSLSLFLPPPPPKNLDMHLTYFAVFVCCEV